MEVLCRSKEPAAAFGGKAGALSGYCDFVIARYAGAIRRASGVVVEKPIDEFKPPERGVAGQGTGATVG